MSIKNKILDSIKWAKEKLGYTLISEEWGDPDHKCACALGCVIVKNNPLALVYTASDNVSRVAEILKVPEDWVDSFTEGFDNNGTSKEADIPEAWELGQEIRKETKPIIYHEWNGE